MTTTHSKTCKAMTKTGDPCAAFCVTGSDYCYNHDPRLAAQRAESRSRGGKARAGRAIRHIPGDDDPPVVAVNTIHDIQHMLEFAITDLLQMERSVKRTNALASLLRVAVTVNEQTELADRITALEEQIAGQHRERTNGRVKY